MNDEVKGDCPWPLYARILGDSHTPWNWKRGESPHSYIRNGYRGEYLCSLWNDVDASSHVLWWGSGGEYPQSKIR